jgi:hypothetical protein
MIPASAAAIPSRSRTYRVVKMSAMPFLSRALLMLCAASLPLAAEFVPPAEGPVPFRRDKLPVDVETMSGLSRQLTLFTGARVADDPDELRAVAQMAALALALDPVNRDARALIDSLKAGKAPEPAAEEDLERARNRAWQVLAWLEMPEAGADGQALAACLGDVLAVADPRHPKARDRRSAGEQGAWKGWVSDESAFRSKETESKSGMEEDEETDEPEEPDNEEKAAAELALNELSSALPVWYYSKELGQMKLAVVPVHLKATILKPEEDKDDDDDDDDHDQPKPPDFQVQVPGEGMTDRFAKAMRELKSAIGERHGSLPHGFQARLDLGKVDYSLSRNGMALTGTTALLIDGAMSGKVPTAITLAVVGEDGKLELPPRFWQTLRAFSASQSTGTRLILPDEAADFLTALVVMDDAAFFMKNEVLLAGSVDELCGLASPTPEAEVADGLKRFDEIRKVGQGKALGTFVAHPATQARLRELAGVMPEHASARMLALQGSGSRPRFLERPVLAREIRSGLEPVGILMNGGPDDIDPEALEKAHESSRAQLDALTGYIDIRDRDLHKAATDVADSLRPLARLLPKKDYDDSNGLIQKQIEAYRTARSEYSRVFRELNQAAGDADEFPLQDAPRKD